MVNKSSTKLITLSKSESQPIHLQIYKRFKDAIKGNLLKMVTEFLQQEHLRVSLMLQEERLKVHIQCYWVREYLFPEGKPVHL